MDRSNIVGLIGVVVAGILLTYGNVLMELFFRAIGV